MQSLGKVASQGDRCTRIQQYRNQIRVLIPFSVYLTHHGVCLQIDNLQQSTKAFCWCCKCNEQQKGTLNGALYYCGDGYIFIGVKAGVCRWRKLRSFCYFTVDEVIRYLFVTVGMQRALIGPPLVYIVTSQPFTINIRPHLSLSQHFLVFVSKAPFSSLLFSLLHLSIQSSCSLL